MDSRLQGSRESKPDSLMMQPKRGAKGDKVAKCDALKKSPKIKSHPHDLVDAIHINYLPGYRRGAVAGQKQARSAKFLREHIASERGMSFIMLEHFCES